MKLQTYLFCSFVLQMSKHFWKQTLSCCHSETEPKVHGLIVRHITPQTFTLVWTAEEDAFDTFVIMVSPAESPGLPRELVLGGDERSAALMDFNEDTEYKVEMFGLVLGKRSQSVMERVRTGTYMEVMDLWTKLLILAIDGFWLKHEIWCEVPVCVCLILSH